MKYHKLRVLPALLASAFALPATADSSAGNGEPVLSTVQVRGEQDAPFVDSSRQSTRTETLIGVQGIANTVRAGQTSIYQALDMAAGVSLESLDAYGVAKMTPGSAMRIRGQSTNYLSLSIEGMPLTGEPRYGSRESAFDAENFGSLRLIKGASPVELGNGYGASAGSVDVSLRELAAERSFQFKQGIGSDNFRRTYLRADSGELASGTRAALSYSNTSADKWRGAGEAPGKRENFFLDVAQRLDNGGSVRLFANHIEYEGNNFRQLSYAQTQDLGKYRDFDFNTSLSGVAAQDAFYYGYNRVKESYTLVGSLLSLPLGDGTLRLKPYYATEKIHNWDGSAKLNGNNATTPGVSDWLSDKTILGVMGEYAWKFAAGEVAVGWWRESMNWPAYTAKTYRLDASSNLTFGGWNGMLKYGSDFSSSAPYARFETTADAWRFTGGIKYLTWYQPSTSFYSYNQVLPDVAHDQIIDKAVKDPTSSVGDHTDRAWLPNLGASVALSPELSLYANVGRTANRNWFGGGNIARTFFTNMTKFQAAGIATADALWQREKLELVDTVDTGARWKHGDFSLVPTVFYSRIKNKAVTFLDPVANVAFKQPAGNATAYGLEVEASWQAMRTTQLFTSLSWNRSTFDDDIRTATNVVVAAKGKQIPDTPRAMAKFGADIRWGAFDFVPLVKWIGSRYGDVTNVEKIPSYVVVDATIRYSGKAEMLGKYEIDLSLVNLFNKRYISSISTADDGGTSSAWYYPGAPRTVALTFGMTF
ncbi:MAG: TonB-dependent receptor [Proteobacteria bacterium]|nr:TonB-dependent receptor [Pseudomonadota bacterium]